MSDVYPATPLGSPPASGPPAAWLDGIPPGMVRAVQEADFLADIGLGGQWGEEYDEPTATGQET